MTSEPRITATSLFFGALRDLLSNPGAVLRIGGVWFVIYLALNALAGLRYAHWVIYDVDQISGVPPSELYVGAVFLMMLGAVASAWHRFIYLREPARFIPRMRLVIIAKYVAGWIGIGIVANLIALVCVVLPVFGGFMLVGMSPLDVLGAIMVADWVRLAGISPGLIVAIVAMIVVGMALSIFLVFRLGVGLPSVAILDGQGLGLGASWRATRGQARAIVGASLWTALATCGLYGAVMAFTPAFGEAYGAPQEVAFRLAGAVSDILAMLVGSAVLTRIYRSAPPASV